MSKKKESKSARKKRCRLSYSKRKGVNQLKNKSVDININPFLFKDLDSFFSPVKMEGGGR